MSSPVVGTAWVRVRLLSQNLGRDIAREVHNEIRANSDAFDRAGQLAGQHVGNGMTRGVNDQRQQIRQAGQRAGDEFGAGFGGRLNQVVTRIFGGAFTRNINVRMGNAGNGAGSSLARGFRRNAPNFLEAGHDLADELHRGFNLGIGAARMGPAIIAALTLAGPSIISGAAALGTGVAGALVAGIAAAGPGIAGIAGLITAGISTAVLNIGLLSLGLKSTIPEMKALTDEATAFKTAVSDTIARGFVDDFRDSIRTLSTRLLPQINDLLRETGAAFGRVAVNIADTVTRADNIGRIRDILATNIEFVNRFNIGIGGLTTSFLILFRAAKPFIDLIGDSIARFGTWLQTTLETKEANGELAAFFENLVVQAKRIGSILSDLGGGLKGIFEAALPSGDRLLTSFGNLAQKFNDFANSAVGQEKLTAFFEKAEILGGRVFDLIGKLGGSLFDAFINVDTGPILAILDIIEQKIAPAIATLFGQIAEGAGDNLVKIFDNIGTALQNLADSEALQKVAGFISDILLKISAFATTDIGGKILAALVPLLLFGGFISSIVGPLSTVIGLLASPALLTAAGIIAAIAAAAALLWTQSENLRNAIGGLVDAVLPKFAEAWERIQPVLMPLWDAVLKLAKAIGDFLAPIIKALTPLLEILIPILGVLIVGAITILTNAIEGLAVLFTWLAGVLETVVAFITLAWNNLGTFLTFIWETIVTTFYSIWSAIVAWWQGLWANIQAIAQTFWTTIQVIAQTIWNAIVTGIMAIVTPIVAFFVGLWNTVVAVLTGVWNFISSLASTIWNWIVTTIQGIVEPIVGWFQQRWQDISDAASRIWNAIVGIATGAWNAVINAIESVVEPVVGWLQGIWNDITSAVSTAFNGLAGPVRAAWDAVYSAIVEPIQNALGVVTDVIDSIVGAVSNALGTVSSFFDQISEKAAAAAELGSVTVTTPFSALGGPAAAEGGYVDPVPGGFPVLVAEGGKRERIEPLDANGLSRRDAAMIQHIMSGTLSAMAGAGGTGNTTVNVRIGERELNDIISTQVVAENRDLQRKLRNGRRPA
jgi:phage-related protein